MTGKIATTAAHSTSATRVSCTQMMISGAIATIGVTCSRIAYGNSDASSQRLWTNKSATSVPDDDRQRQRGQRDRRA